MPPKKQYSYQEDMPYAREPLKTLYVCQRMFTTLVMVAWWALYYSVMPRSYRPRPSWSVKCCIAVNFTRRIYKVTELAGVTWGTRDPDQPCDNRKLKRTRFEWVDPLPEELRTGIIADPQVPFKRVGCFVWPKERPKIIPTCPGKEELHADEELMDGGEFEAAAGEVPVIGIFLHGGGYCHMSAHEGAPTSQIPERLMKDKVFTEIHAVEYRLLQHAPFPAAVQDAAAVYAHIVERHQRRGSKKAGSSRSEMTVHGEETTKKDSHEMMDYLAADSRDYQMQAKHKRENDEIHARVAEVVAHTHCKIVLIGDSAGGNLVLALARWIRDEGVLPPPDALLLLSPSCDPSHAFPETPSCYVPRPHADTDYLVDTPEPRALLQRTFLGHNPVETMHSPYVSPASSRVLRAFYGDAFAESVADLTIAQLDDHHRQFLRTMCSVPATPVPSTPIIGGGGYANGHARGSPKPAFVTGPPEAASDDQDRSPTSLAHPIIASPRGLSLFTEFPKTCVVLGDAERLEREVMRLVGAMERDGVDVHTIWVKDAPHDVLMMGWWDESVRDAVWAQIEEWVRRV
ncbi:alpha/beta-hydrolase [Trametes coccinea BRFM310]|uniref:Alpha/beta-hydrolase n=1 Tax=Trametes coccinea (strain BRFM310) TaxID=1353009 RepID=A0A1Y2IME9_TRAC3|nr:alpha/beta-hydrolase [Trametes coccinea BRFM310]